MILSFQQIYSPLMTFLIKWSPRLHRHMRPSKFNGDVWGGNYRLRPGRRPEAARGGRAPPWARLHGEADCPLEHRNRTPQPPPRWPVPAIGGGSCCESPGLSEGDHLDAELRRGLPHGIIGGGTEVRGFRGELQAGWQRGAQGGERALQEKVCESVLR